MKNRIVRRASVWSLAGIGLGVALSSAGHAAETAPGAADAPATAPKIKIALVGDSTVTDKAGWGVGFAQRLNEGAVCLNQAASGRSSKSYRDEGRWEKALALHPDYVLIQFGHNDMPGKGPSRETDPDTTFAENLRRYVDEARAQNAKPVLITSLTRRTFGADGKIKSTLVPYANATKKVAAEKQVPLIDLHALSIALLNGMKREEIPALEPKSPAGKLDHTHLNAKGSEVFGGIVADELAKVAPELAPVIRAR